MDIDEVHAVLSDAAKVHALEHQPVDIEQIGMAQHYCVACAQYFETEHALVEHKRGKTHKRRLRLVKEVPYSHEEADLGAGINSAKSKHAVRRTTRSTSGAAKTGGDVVMT